MKLTFSVLLFNEVTVDVKRTVVSWVLSEDLVCVQVTVMLPVSVTVTVAFGRGQQSLHAALLGSLAKALSNGLASSNNSTLPIFSIPLKSSAGVFVCSPPVLVSRNPSRRTHQDPFVIGIIILSYPTLL